MKWLKRISLGLALIFLLIIGIAVLEARFAHRKNSESRSTITLPETSEFVHYNGDFNEKVYIWKLPQEKLNALTPPSHHKQLFDLSKDWIPFDGRSFGLLQADEVPPQSEICYYRTPFWDIALVRNKPTQTLIISAIYTN